MFVKPIWTWLIIVISALFIKGKLARLEMYFSGVVFVQSKMAGQIFTRKGEAIEPWLNSWWTVLWKSVSPIEHAKNVRWNWSSDVKNVGFLEFVYLIIRGWPFLSHSNIHFATHLQCLFSYLWSYVNLRHH